MAVSPLIVTAGASNANGLCSVAFATQFHTDRPGFASAVAWLAATADEKVAAIIAMSRRLSSAVRWNGYVVTQTQALAFPRYSLTGRNGYLIDSTTIPIEIQEATAEGAAQLLLDAEVDAAAGESAQAQGITSIKAGPVSLTFSEGGASASYSGAIPDSVWLALPWGWGYAAGRSEVRSLVRA